MTRTRPLALATTLLLLTAISVDADDPPAWPSPQVSVDPRVPQRVSFPADDAGPLPKLAWHPTWPHIVTMRTRGGAPDAPAPRVTLHFNQDATQINLLVPDLAPGQHIVVDTADKTQQFIDGTWAFVASDAKVTGQRAALESHPGNFRIGFWTNAEDFVTWDFAATRWGMYEVELTYSLAGGSGSDVTVSVGEAKVTATIKPTESWWHYTTVSLGKLYLADAGRKTLIVRGTKTGAAVMNLKAVVLRPAPEGADWPLKPGDDGAILLHSKDAQVNGVTLRYEPKPEKNTLGYWSNAGDQAAWSFQTPEGEYDVELLQGAGKGQGGSEAEARIDDQIVKFTAEDTGGWQSFKARIVGRVRLAAGVHTLTLAPTKKAGVAVMDVRQVRLIPVKQ